MGYRIYGEPEEKRSRISEFIEWFMVTLFWFPYAIGGWLVHFGMPTMMMMVVLTLIIAVIAAWRLSKAK